VTTLSPPHPATSTKQRVALVLMGAWLAGTVCTSVVATENFYTIDRLLAGSPNAAFATAVRQLGPPQARDLLRYLSSELNRLYFQLWNVAQVAIGAAVLWLIGRDRALTRARWGVVAMLSSVVLMVAAHTGDRFAGAQPRFRPARSTAVGHAALLDAPRCLHVARDAQAPRRNCRGGVDHANSFASAFLKAKCFRVRIDFIQSELFSGYEFPVPILRFREVPRAGYRCP